MILSYKFRVKDSSTSRILNRHARAVNQVWNYCCQIQREAQDRWKQGRVARWPSHYDLTKLTSGISGDLGIHSDTIGEICRQFSASRSAIKKPPRYRSSRGAKRALGWVPFKGRWTRVEGATVTYLKRKFCFWKSRDIPPDIRTGAFVQDARGRWYVTFQCEVPDPLPTGQGTVGIDLGLKTLATCTDGSKVPALQHYRQHQSALAVAQRANNKRRVRAIHAKIANTRRHHLHEQSTRITRENATIVVGNVNAAKLAKTKMAKSILDASWSEFRSQLAYKARRHQAVYIEADERFSTQTCSCCGVIPASSPKGRAGLGMRTWTCSECGETHDRDVNAARNILRSGLERQPPAEGNGKSRHDVNHTTHMASRISGRGTVSTPPTV